MTLGRYPVRFAVFWAKFLVNSFRFKRLLSAFVIRISTVSILFTRYLAVGEARSCDMSIKSLPPALGYASVVIQKPSSTFIPSIPLDLHLCHQPSQALFYQFP